MGLLHDFKGKYKTISIVGMGKNSGKTTTLNYIIEEAIDEGIILGITSTGRDGESSDIVTGTEKPKIYLDMGTIVSVPTKLYDFSDAGLEILKMTKYGTSLGDIMICRVAESGYVQIAGPLNIVDHKKLCQEMIGYGAEMIIIDGAIDRKSIAAPGTSDAVVLATGAVLSRSMKKVVEETMHVVNLYGLSTVKDKNILDILEKNISFGKIFSISTLKSNRTINILKINTGLGGSRFIDEMINDDTEYIYIPGALTKGVIEDINREKLKRIKIILKDPTKIFIDYSTWQQDIKKGMRVEVIENINVVAITVNPCAPQGYSFDSDEIINQMKAITDSIPIVDVRKSI